MKTLYLDQYGGSEVLSIREVREPEAEAARAIEYVATKRARGKVVIRFGDAAETI